MNIDNFKLFCINVIFIIGILGRLLSRWLSTLLIKAVNKFAPPEEEVKRKPAVATVSLEEDSVKAINIAVEKLTGGKGKVMKIEKLN